MSLGSKQIELKDEEVDQVLGVVTCLVHAVAYRVAIEDNTELLEELEVLLVQLRYCFTHL